uniref:RNA-binding protein 48 n=1 Tax=Eptatretus burgeri TaxID=7764 RepID=A0A8C4NI74_EPTBU
QGHDVCELSSLGTHHPQRICLPRQGNIVVYTIVQESCYLLIQGVPALSLMEELVALFAQYGAVDEYRILHEYPAEKFTEVYWVKLQKLQSARIAKRKLDGRSFFGGVLHICYAPEFESIDETRDKIQWRQRQVERICTKQATFMGTFKCPLNADALSNNAGTDDKRLLPAVCPGSGRSAEMLSCGQSTLSKWQQGNKTHSRSSLARFVPRVAALQLRKISRDNECKNVNVFTTEGETVMAPFVGPELPGIPKTVDLGDASLNTTADFIRTKLNKVNGSLEKPVLQSEHPSAPASKQRRRI